MRRATAYGNFCSQVVLVYLHPFRRRSFFTYALQPKIAKKLLKPSILGLRVVQGH